MKGIIAELGCMHLGSLDKAKELIEVAAKSGADYVKMQAIDPLELSSGSMPFEFYNQCSMSMDDYINCLEYARCIVGIPLFFSVFGIKYQELAEKGDYYKISGHQYTEFSNSFLKGHNNKKTIVSIPQGSYLRDHVENMHIMFVTPYNTKNANLHYINKLRDYYKKPIGYSDHSTDLDNCFRAIDTYEVQLIEKHFYLGDDIKFKDQLYRDCIHSANPDEFSQLAK